MHDTARQQLRDTVATGDTPGIIDRKVADAAPDLTEEHRAALWLYAWSLAGGKGRGRRPAEIVNPFAGVRCATCGTGWYPRRSELLVSAGARCPRCHGSLAR